MRPDILVESGEAVFQLEALLEFLRDDGCGGEAVAKEQHKEQDTKRAHLTRKEHSV